jgi:hypothetical protein
MKLSRLLMIALLSVFASAALADDPQAPDADNGNPDVDMSEINDREVGNPAIDEKEIDEPEVDWPSI